MSWICSTLSNSIGFGSSILVALLAAGLLGGVDPALFRANSIILDLDLEGVNGAGLGDPTGGGDEGVTALGEVGRAGGWGIDGTEAADWADGDKTEGAAATVGDGTGGGIGGAVFLAKMLDAMDKAGGVGVEEDPPIKAEMVTVK